MTPHDPEIEHKIEKQWLEWIEKKRCLAIGKIYFAIDIAVFHRIFNLMYRHGFLLLPSSTNRFYNIIEISICNFDAAVFWFWLWFNIIKYHSCDRLCLYAHSIHSYITLNYTFNIISFDCRSMLQYCTIFADRLKPLFGKCWSISTASVRNVIEIVNLKTIERMFSK